MDINYLNIKIIKESLFNHELKIKYIRFFNLVYNRKDIINYTLDTRLKYSKESIMLKLITQNNEQLYLNIYKLDTDINFESELIKQQELINSNKINESTLYTLVFSQYFKPPNYDKYILNLVPVSKYKINIEFCYIFIDNVPFKISDFISENIVS